MPKAILIFDGVKMPTPKVDGFKISKNKIWSKNTGRNGNGEMIGTIIAIKRKVEIVWPPLGVSEAKKIDEIVSSIENPYHSVSYTDEAGEITTITAYFNDAIYPIMGTNVAGRELLVGVGINGIEK